MEFLIFDNNNIKRFDDLKKAWEFLKEVGEFSVFLQFIDPRTDCLVSGDFTFYPDPQQTMNGWQLLAEHNGLSIKIPSNLEFYAQHQGKCTPELILQSVILERGKYVNRQTPLFISPNLRTWSKAQDKQ